LAKVLIESVDFFYVAIPNVRAIGDGSQDALLVRVRAGGFEGWGECEAAPLVSIASFVCPMSHSACHPVGDAVLGQPLDTPDDIRRITAEVRRLCFDLLQADHTLSGIDIALWDLLGKRYEQPVYRLLGYECAYAREAYASQLFGDTPEETYRKAVTVREGGFRAAKFGWGPYGAGTVAEDAAQVEAARTGLGPDVALMVDAGTIWEEDVEAAAARLAALEAARAEWLEEPFANGALHAYRALAARTGVSLAAGEGAHNPYQAFHLIDYGDVRTIQIDAGRIGGITSAHIVARYARQRGVTYINHTFTTPLALSASLQPYAGLAECRLCEFPVEASPLAAGLTLESLSIDGEGRVHLPDRPGLGMTPDPATIRRYLQPVEIRVGDRMLYTTPSI
jgi:L-alanine-DL-glutamate epimerase-like enolase superfamily enzyme